MAAIEQVSKGRSTERVAALVAALLGVRTDHVSARFDAEVEAALVANRVDVQTARALRFWQRASVQAAEEYIGAAVAGALAAHDEADRQALIDATEAAAAWQQATEADATRETEAAEPSQPLQPPQPSQPTQLTRRLISLRDGRPSHRSTKETERAVRAALRFDDRQIQMPIEGKDGGHARAATSA